MGQPGNERVNQLDRQNFEDQAESIISKCGNAIKQMKENAFKQIHTSQYKEHLENVFYLLEKYLESKMLFLFKLIKINKQFFKSLISCQRFARFTVDKKRFVSTELFRKRICNIFKNSIFLKSGIFNVLLI